MTRRRPLTQAPTKPRYHIHVHLGPKASQPPLKFLFDTGAAPSCIDHSTYAAAKQAGAVRPYPEGQLNVTSADGSAMATAGAQLLTLSLDDGYTFEAPVQVAPNLNKPGILGQNILDPLGITVCPVTKRLVRGCVKPIAGIPVNASVMACDEAELAQADAQAEAELNQAHLSDNVWGPVCDLNEEPLNDPGEMFTFYPTENIHIPSMTGRKVTLQAYDPNGNIYRHKTDFIASIAPAGGCIAHTTDMEGKFSVYVDNPTIVPQMVPTHLVCAIGTTMDGYYSSRGVKPTAEPQPWTPAEIAAYYARPRQQAPLDPQIQEQIAKHVQEVPAAQQEKLFQLLSKYHRIFSKDKFDLGLTTKATHTIELEDKSPAFTKQFTIPEAHREFLISNLRNWIKAGLVKKCVSKYNAPIFIVPKKDKSPRVVLDYRKLNAKTMPDRYTIRTLEACLADVGRHKSKIFTTLDLTSAFWQMALDEGSQHYTAFTLPGFGQFQWTRGAMGLTGCPASFARIMDKIMEDLDHVITYIDDVLIHSQDHDSHLIHLDQAFMRLEANNLKINLAKCEIMRNSVAYLGFTISHLGVLPGKNKTDIIRHAPCPTSPRQLQSFIGTCNFFRSFIKNFAMKAGPLYDLIRPDSTWTEGPMPQAAQTAFKQIRDEIAAKPRLGLPAPQGELHLYVDAALGDEDTAGGLGAVLFQQQGDSKNFVPLGFASRRLQKAESRYPIHNLELQAAVYGIESFDHLLRGRQFNIFTDHRPLESQTKLQTKTLNRLQELLGRHRCSINYIKGKNNVVADYLSRFSHNDMAAISSSPPLFITAMEEAYKRAQEMNSLSAMCSREEIIFEQKQCPQASKIILAITGQSQETPTPVSMAYKLLDGVLCATEKKGGQPTRVFVPTSLRRRYMALAHKSVGHSGEHKTLDRMKKFTYWPDMTADLRMFLPSCGPCSIKKRDPHLQNKLPVKPLPQEDHPNARVHLDLHGPLQAENRAKKYILVCTDAFSKVVQLVVIPNKEEKTVADAFLAQWCYIFGFPKAIVTDQGKEFTNKLLKAILDASNVRHYTTAPYHPQSNGQTEVFNRTMDRYLRATLHQDKLDTHQWEGLVAHLAFVYNTSLHRAIKQTPFNVLFGYDPRVPGFEEDAESLTRTLNKLSMEEIKSPQKRWDQAKQANEKHRETLTERHNKATSFPLFKTGDKVQILKDQYPAHTINPKLQPQWINGVIAHLGRTEHNYFVRLGTSRKITLVHASKLRLQTTADEEAEDPTVKPTATHRAVDTTRRITRALAKLQQGETAVLQATKKFNPPPPGCAWSKLDLINMFQAYAAHKLTPPDFTVSTYGAHRPQAAIPVPHNAPMPVPPEPVPDMGPQDNLQAQLQQEADQQRRHEQRLEALRAKIAARKAAGPAAAAPAIPEEEEGKLDQATGGPPAEEERGSPEEDQLWFDAVQNSPFDASMRSVSRDSLPDYETPESSKKAPAMSSEEADMHFLRALAAAKTLKLDGKPVPTEPHKLFEYYREINDNLRSTIQAVIEAKHRLLPQFTRESIQQYYAEESHDIIKTLEARAAPLYSQWFLHISQAPESPSPGRGRGRGVSPKPPPPSIGMSRGRGGTPPMRPPQAPGSTQPRRQLFARADTGPGVSQGAVPTRPAPMGPPTKTIAQTGINPPLPAAIPPSRRYESWQDTPAGQKWLRVKAAKPKAYRDHVPLVTDPRANLSDLAQCAKQMLQLPLSQPDLAHKQYERTVALGHLPETRPTTLNNSLKSLIKQLAGWHNDEMHRRWQQQAQMLQAEVEFTYNSQP